MRLIDADALDEEVANFFLAITGNPKQATVVRECKKSFSEMIEEQPTCDAAKTQQWIPANMPPENDRYILLSFANFSVPLVGRYEANGDGGAYYVGDDDDSCISQDMIVNAWQELPEPYREEA